MLNIISRRSFLESAFLAGAGVGLASLTNIPLVMKRALAAGNIGLNGKKVFFIFLRGANDGLNNVLPYGDASYIGAAGTTASSLIRPNIAIPRLDSAANYSGSLLTNNMDYNTTGNSDLAGVDTYAFNGGINAGNGFAAVHPSLKFLAPVYNAGDLAIVDRVGYPKQSRSHFDSQNYYEIAQPGENVDKQGVWYKAMYSYLLNNPNASLTGVSVQSALPLSLRGNKAAMTNLSDPTRYDVLGIPHVISGNPNLGNSNDYWGDIKALNAVTNANNVSFPNRKSRDMLQVQYKNVVETLKTFTDINFTEGPDIVQPVSPTDYSQGNVFIDDENTDGDRPYYLFPTTDIKNGGWRRLIGTNVGGRYVIPQGNGNGSYTFMNNVKAAALILNKTSARIAGTEIGGWDTHVGQVNSAADTTHGQQANLLRCVGWAIYGLYKFFKIYGVGGSRAMPGAQASWNDVTVVVMSEFGRTTIGNGTLGTDHAEGSMCYVAGGAVRGLGQNPTNGNSGVYGCHTSSSTKAPWVQSTYTVGSQTGTGSLFGATGRYLQRGVDYRSVLGEIFKKHMGATQSEVEFIIPGYADPNEKLAAGGTVTAASGVDSQDTFIAGEVGLFA